MISLIRREISLALRAGSGALTGVLFFLAVVTIVPFAIGPDLKLLARIGPAVLWIGALLASLLGLERLFSQDREDGSLDILVIQARSVGLTVLAKCLAHWIVTGLPLVLAVPLFGLMLNLSPLAIASVMATLAVGTPAIAFIGAVGAAVTVTLPRGGLLISILILPLVIPVLIFGVSAVNGAIRDPDPFTAPFLILCAITLFTGVVGPLASAMMLRHSAE